MHREGGMGVQIRPEEWWIIKAICAGVMASAAMSRSPSFSRWGESSTIMNSLFPVGGVSGEFAGEGEECNSLGEGEVG